MKKIQQLFQVFTVQEQIKHESKHTFKINYNMPITNQNTNILYYVTVITVFHTYVCTTTSLSQCHQTGQWRMCTIS